ncbi:MAG: glycosyltransferase family 39 protein [Armatimonadetes bacterium]|nr:glycosyltransferase family 39 protein [Armatimonadota bacterium]
MTVARPQTCSVEAQARHVPVWFVATAACLWLLFAGLGTYPLLDPDEGRYAEVPREMIESGDWVTPRLNYVPYFEKPPLTYWIVGASMRLFGQTELAARLAPAAFGFLGMLVACWLGAVTLGPAAARWAAAVLVTSPMFFAMARIPATDIFLSVLFAGALTAYWSGENGRARVWPSRVLAGLLLGLAILAKGPVALVLFAGILGTYLLWTRRLGQGLVPLLSVLGMAAIVAAPWFLVVAARNPQFNHYFFVVQHFQRFTGDHFSEHRKPVYYFPALLVLGWLWWSGLWPISLKGAYTRWRGLSDDRRRAVAFLICWCAVVVVFFSLSSCKLAPYILPCWWPLAVVTTALTHRLLDRPAVGRGTQWVIRGTGATLVLLTPALYWYSGHQNEIAPDAIRAPAVLLCLAWAAAGICFLAAPAIAGVERRMGLLVAAAWLALAGLIPVFATASAKRDVYALLPAQLRPVDKNEGWVVAQYRCYNQSLNFYTRSRVIVIDSVGEIRLGLNEPDADQWFLEGEDEIDRLSSRGPLALVVSDRDARRVADAHDLDIWALGRDRGLLINQEARKLLGPPPGKQGTQ